MENQIFEVGAGLSKSMVLRDNEIWFSQNKVSNLEKFEKAINKTGMLQSAYSIPLSSIYEVSYNEASESTKIRYTNEKGKEKKLNIGFNEESLSNEFGQYLGDKLKLARSTKKESQIKPLLLNVIGLLISVGATIWLASMDDTATLAEGGSRRSRNNGAILKLIVDTVGQTGVLIIGGLISLYLAYKLYKRFKNPATEVLYRRG